jgi:putative transposase
MENMPMEKVLPSRKRLRLENYDYASAGVYAVTICTYDRGHYFGVVKGESVILSVEGMIVQEYVEWTGKRLPHVFLDEYIVMPNHVHMILFLEEEQRGGSRTAPTETKKTLGRIVGAFKTVSAKQINLLRQTPGSRLWQRSFHDHIIRSHRDLENHRHYIFSNPANWATDELFPDPMEISHS